MAQSDVSSIYAAVGYDAYKESTNGVSLITGQKLPHWKDLPENIQQAWEKAAEAVILAFIPNQPQP
jgi:hypothetical protein